MPSSPDATILAGTKVAQAWQPMPLQPGIAPPTAFALPAFQREAIASPSLRAFAIDRTAGIPADLLATETAAARASGYANGYSTGITEARSLTALRLAAEATAAETAIAARDAATAQAFEALFDAADELEQRAVPTSADIEEQIVTAAWTIAEAIIGQVLADTPTRSQSALTRALALAPADDDVTVSVGMADFAALGGDTTSMTPLRRERGLRTVVITADESLSPGDALAKSGATAIDARLTTAIERVRKVLAP